MRPAPRVGPYALALVACSERQVAPGPEPASAEPPAVEAPPAAAPPAPAPAEPPQDRGCGEAGDTPTELPPRLAGGLAKIGRATLRPGETRSVGTTTLRYDPSAWIGTMKAGYRGPALHLEIDRAEVPDGHPWGALIELRAGQTLHRVIGPYRFDLRSGAGDPPAELEIAVERDGCPGAVEIAPTTAPRWLWLSTEGIRQHTYDLHGALLQLVLDTHAGEPRLDVSLLSYRQWFEPRPGPPRRVRAGRHFVTVDRVVPGPGTRFTDRWQADGEPRLHARARIEPAAPATAPEPIAATTACGDAGPARTTLPAALAKRPTISDTHTLEPGDAKVKAGPLTLAYGWFEIPAHGGGPYRVEAKQVPNLQILGDATSSRAATGPFHEPRLVRSDRELLRLSPVSGDTLKVERLTLPCPHLHTSARPSAPTYVWLSSVGHAWVEMGSPRALLLQVHEDPKRPSLGLSADHAYFTRQLGADLVGLGFTIDDFLVEIVDVLEDRGGPVPAVHVQLRVSPAD